MRRRGSRPIRAVVGGLLVLIVVLVFVDLLSEVRRANRLVDEVREVEDELSSAGLELGAFLVDSVDAVVVGELIERYELLGARARGAPVFDGLAEEQLTALAIAVRKLVETEAEAIGSREFDARQRDVLSRVRGTRFELLALADRAERLAVAAGRRTGFAALGLILLVVAAALLATTRVSRRVVPRARAIKDALKEMEEGRWPAEVEVREDDEIGELAATFNAVTVARRRSEEELRQVHEELEERVARRTEDLARANRALEKEAVDRRRAEERLVESERYVATGRMAARIAHEINNPLAGIKNAFRLIKGSVPDDHPHHRYVGRIDGEIDRLAGIVRQMYGIYRPDSRGLFRFEARAVIEDVVALIAASGSPVTVPEIRLELPEAKVTLNQLDGMLRQVLYNLLQNAIEASPAGGAVEVRARVAGETLVLTVADRGEGIGEADRGRVFEPFFTTKEGREDCGLGLGLAISRRAAEAMGGHLELTTAAGVGSTFTLTIPLDAERAEEGTGAFTPPA